MKKQLETISTTDLNNTTGGFGARWALNHPYRAEAFLDNHPRIAARWESNHPYATARLDARFGC